MEKRFVLFLALSLGILVGYAMLARTFFPPPPVAEQNDDVADDDVADGDVADGDIPANPDDAEPDDVPKQPAPTVEPATEDATADDNAAQQTPTLPTEVKQRWETLGSYAAGGGHSLSDV